MGDTHETPLKGSAPTIAYSLTIQTDEGPREIEAQLRKSGLAIHAAEPETRTIHASRYGRSTVHRTAVYTTTAAITHVTSGMQLTTALNPAMAAQVCRRLERSGVDWHRPGEQIAADEEARDALRTATGWHADEMLRLAAKGLNLRQPETAKEVQP